jgi:hypothetical protein
MRAKLIPEHDRTLGVGEFPAVVQVNWPSYRGGVDYPTRYGELRDLILDAGLEVFYSSTHVIGRDPEPPSGIPELSGS